MILITYILFYYISNAHFFITFTSYIVYVHFLITFLMHIFEVHFGAFKMLKFFLQTTIRDHLTTRRIRMNLPIKLSAFSTISTKNRFYTDLITPIKINGELQFNRILWNTSWLEYNQRSHLHSRNTLEWKDHSAPRHRSDELLPPEIQRESSTGKQRVSKKSRTDLHSTMPNIRQQSWTPSTIYQSCHKQQQCRHTIFRQLNTQQFETTQQDVSRDTEIPIGCWINHRPSWPIFPFTFHLFYQYKNIMYLQLFSYDIQYYGPRILKVFQKYQPRS